LLRGVPKIALATNLSGS